jgi:competence protein ComEC
VRQLCRRRSASRQAVGRWVLVAVALVGAAWFTVRTQPGPRDVSHLAGTERRLVTVEGVLTETPRQSRRPDNPLLPRRRDSDRTTGMHIKVFSVTTGAERRQADGRLRVIVRESFLTARPEGVPNGCPWPPQTGDRLTITGLLREPGRPRNPGQRDIRAIYATGGIGGILTTDYWGAVRIRRAPWWSVRGWMGHLRARLREAMPTGDSAGARIVPALFLGDRSELLDADEQSFIRSGVMHYLAVSGLHVALLSGVLIVVLRLALVSPRWRGVCLAVFIVCYALATELRPSVVRAGTFFLLLSVAWLLGRRRDMLNTLAAAALVVLVLNPADLFRAGFQLSFLVAMGLMVVCPRLRDALFGRHEWTHYAEMGAWRRSVWQGRVALENFASTCLTAWLFAAPLAAYHFHLIAPVGIVATFAIFPVVAALMIVGLVATVVALVPGVSAAPLAGPIEWLSRLLESLVATFERIPYGHTYVRSFDWPWVVATVALLLAWAYRRELHLSWRRLAAALTVAVAGYVCLGVPRGPSAADGVRVTTLAIGSGNTVLVQGPGGGHVLVDCGSSLLAERTADIVTAPALWALGVDRLDAVVLTHADADHVKDLPAVLARIPTDRVILPEGFLTDEKTYDDRVLKWLHDEGYDIETVQRGDRLPITDRLQLQVLSPPEGLSPETSTNAHSIVLAVRHAGTSMLLTGDATPMILRQLAALPEARADALLLPHHGEESAALAALLDATGAKIGVMSVGHFRDTRRRHTMVWPPGLRVLKTCEKGAVTVLLNDDGVRVETFLD